MIKFRSSTDLPLLRWLESKGVEIPDDTAGQLGLIRDYIKAAMRQYNSLDQDSQQVLKDIYTDMSLSRMASPYMQKAMNFYLDEVEKEENNG